MLPAQAYRNEYALTVNLINLGLTGPVIKGPAVLFCRFKPGQGLLIGPRDDLAAGIHAGLKLLQ